ncbi:MAG: hypothetical protein CMI63_20050 [Parvularcula sp.]|nr:hypothetical protein [Parvularcula sp.]
MTRNEPAVLYKYRDDSPYTESMLLEKRVWLSTAQGLNDPLECQIGEIPKEWQEKTIHSMECAQIMGALTQFPGRQPTTLFSLTPRQTRHWRNKVKRMPHPRQMRAVRALYADHGVELSRPEEIFVKLRRQLQTVGIFSLSEAPDSELMWSHYANGHRGLVFGFQRNNSNQLGNSVHTMRVTYADEKPTLTAGFKQEVSLITSHGAGIKAEARLAFDDPVFRASISTKTLTWNYEREWRYVESGGGLQPYPGPIVEIIFGYKMPQSRRDYYRALLKNSGLSPKEFEMTLQAGSGYELRSLP